MSCGSFTCSIVIFNNAWYLWPTRWAAAWRRARPGPPAPLRRCVRGRRPGRVSSSGGERSWRLSAVKRPSARLRVKVYKMCVLMRSVWELLKNVYVVRLCPHQPIVLLLDTDKRLPVSVFHVKQMEYNTISFFWLVIPVTVNTRNKYFKTIYFVFDYISSKSWQHIHSGVVISELSRSLLWRQDATPV